MEKLSFLDSCEQLLNEKLLRCKTTGYEPKTAKMLNDFKDSELVVRFPNFFHIDEQLYEQIEQVTKYLNNLEQLKQANQDST